MNRSMGIERDEKELKEGIQSINFLITQAKELSLGQLRPSEAIVAEDLLLLGKALLYSALERRESRGAHFRRDYPERNDERYLRTTVATCFEKDEIQISFKKIGEGIM